jgi:hypothetical protein
MDELEACDLEPARLDRERVDGDDDEEQSDDGAGGGKAGPVAAEEEGDSREQEGQVDVEAPAVEPEDTETVAGEAERGGHENDDNEAQEAEVAARGAVAEPGGENCGEAHEAQEVEGEVEEVHRGSAYGPGAEAYKNRTLNALTQVS